MRAQNAPNLYVLLSQMWTFTTVTAHCNDVLYVCGHLGNMMCIIHVIPDLAIGCILTSIRNCTRQARSTCPSYHSCPASSYNKAESLGLFQSRSRSPSSNLKILQKGTSFTALLTVRCDKRHRRTQCSRICPRWTQEAPNWSWETNQAISPAAVAIIHSMSCQ